METKNSQKPVIYNKDEPETFEDVNKNAFKNFIYCHCVFEWKDNLKQLGFKWDPDLKLWRIAKHLFTQDIYNKSRAIRFEKPEKKYYFVHYYSVSGIKKKQKEILERELETPED